MEKTDRRCVATGAMRIDRATVELMDRCNLAHILRIHVCPGSGNELARQEVSLSIGRHETSVRQFCNSREDTVFLQISVSFLT